MMSWGYQQLENIYKDCAFIVTVPFYKEEETIPLMIGALLSQFDEWENEGWFTAKKRPGILFVGEHQTFDDVWQSISKQETKADESTLYYLTPHFLNSYQSRLEKRILTGLEKNDQTLLAKYPVAAISKPPVLETGPEDLRDFRRKAWSMRVFEKVSQPVQSPVAVIDADVEANVAVKTVGDLLRPVLEDEDIWLTAPVNLRKFSGDDAISHVMDRLMMGPVLGSDIKLAHEGAMVVDWHVWQKLKNMEYDYHHVCCVEGQIAGQARLKFPDNIRQIFVPPKKHKQVSFEAMEERLPMVILSNFQMIEQNVDTLPTMAVESKSLPQIPVLGEKSYGEALFRDWLSESYERQLLQNLQTLWRSNQDSFKIILDESLYDKLNNLIKVDGSLDWEQRPFNAEDWARVMYQGLLGFLDIPEEQTSQRLAYTKH